MIYTSLYAIVVYFDGFYLHYMHKRKSYPLLILCLCKVIMLLIIDKNPNNVAYKQQKRLICIIYHTLSLAS